MKNEEEKFPKLDFRTQLFLNIIRAVKVHHPPIVPVETKNDISLDGTNVRETFIFENYQEYLNYYLMYLDTVDENLICVAILKRGKKGQIVALKKLCEMIIVKAKMHEFYSRLSQKQIDEIHAKGNLTPYDIVELWKTLGLCMENDVPRSSRIRCEYFRNCDECYKEAASHSLEYDVPEYLKVLYEGQDTSLKRVKKDSKA